MHIIKKRKLFDILENDKYIYIYLEDLNNFIMPRRTRYSGRPIRESDPTGSCRIFIGNLVTEIDRIPSE